MFVLLAAGIVALVVIAAGIWLAVRPARGPEMSATTPRLSIVVLPFANLSGDPAQDYLADVLTEGLTTGLSRISGTFVIARSTAFTYKGKPVDVKQIGRDLSVRYVLEGSEQHSGNQVRVNAQLIDAETGAHLWADQFDADRGDVLQMQDEVVTRLRRAEGGTVFTELILASALALTGQPAEARETLKRYATLIGVTTTTIAQLRKEQLSLADNPRWVAYNERLFEGLRKAGMPEE